MSESLPKIRTSMQMSKASIDALRSFQLSSQVRTQSDTESVPFPKKILKIPEFNLVDSAAEINPKAVSFHQPQRTTISGLSPASDPTHSHPAFHSHRKSRKHVVFSSLPTSPKQTMDLSPHYFLANPLFIGGEEITKCTQKRETQTPKTRKNIGKLKENRENLATAAFRTRATGVQMQNSAKIRQNSVSPSLA